MNQKPCSLTGTEPPDATQTSRKSKLEIWMNCWRPSMDQLQSVNLLGAVAIGGGYHAPADFL